MAEQPIGLGVVGLGRAFSLMLPTFTRDPRFRLVAAATPGAPGREAFSRDLGGRAYDSVEGLCADDGVRAVYIASPHEFHCDHVCQLADAGKHLLVDKPLAISMEESNRMVEAVDRAGVGLVCGPSHSFDAPVLLARRLIDSGDYGAVRHVHAVYHTDFLYRPRRAAELDTGQGGGVVFSQGVHQVDVTRFLAGGKVSSVQALTGNWDPDRPTEGAYGALLSFEDGAFASLTYNGYGRFRGDSLMEDVGELGLPRDPKSYTDVRQPLRNLLPKEEAERKRQRNLGFAGTGDLADPLPPFHEHFGLVIVSCEYADLRLYPDGVEVYGERRERFRLAPPELPRREVMDELYSVVARGQRPVHDVRWARASLEATIAILDAARDQAPVTLEYQVPLPTDWQAAFGPHPGFVPVAEATHNPNP